MRRAKTTGSVVQIRGKFYARRRIDGKDVYGKGRDTRDEAEQDRLQWGKVVAAPKLRSQSPLLGDWAMDCLEGSWGQGLAAKTYETNELYRLRWLNSSRIARLRLNQITRTDCQEFIDGIHAVKRWKEDGEQRERTQPASPSYVRRVAAFVSKLLSLAVREELIDRNPMQFVDLPKIQERENRVLSPEEALKLLNPTTRTGALLLVAMHCGLRRTELTRLQWKHIDERRKLLTVPGTKTASARRVVPLTAEAMAALKAQPRRCDYVFSTENGTPLRPDNVTEDVRLAKKELGLPDEMRLHDLRGSFISLLLEQGTSVRTVMELVGHRDPRTTLKAYARSSTADKERALAGFSKALKQAKKAGAKSA